MPVEPQRMSLDSMCTVYEYVNIKGKGKVVTVLN
jgi:hypothetical protein